MTKAPAQTYSRLIGVPTPGLVLILVDQSSSMDEPAGRTHPGEPASSKAEMAAAAVNNVIYDLQRSCQAGSRIKDRCFVGVITYGERVDYVLGGWISQVADAHTTSGARERSNGGPAGHAGREQTVWIEPRASGGTPMDVAFDDAYAVSSSWIADHIRCFPPVVINITDGDPNDLQHGGDGSRTQAAARRLMSLASDDGNLLLFNAHISGGSGNEIALPTSSSSFGDRYAKFLFGISSPIPDPILAKARKNGLTAAPGARGLVYNARRENLIRLLAFGSTHVLR